jgi:GNAT superfamily N-acetyltransferase
MIHRLGMLFQDPSRLLAGITLVLIIAVSVALFIYGPKHQPTAAAGEFDLAATADRVRPCEVQPYSHEDFGRCCELYRLNEPNQFPPDAIGEFESSLKDSPSSFITLRIDGEIVGVGGLNTSRDDGYRVLKYGLIDPNHHRKGLGTTLLLARLSQLSPDEPYHAIVLWAVPSSVGFYEQYGFRAFAREQFHGM